MAYALMFGGHNSLIGFEAWITPADGSSASLLHEIWPGSIRDLDNFHGATIGGTLIFSADDGFAGLELWSTDGTRQAPRC